MSTSILQYPESEELPDSNVSKPPEEGHSFLQSPVNFENWQQVEQRKD